MSARYDLSFLDAIDPSDPQVQDAMRRIGRLLGGCSRSPVRTDEPPDAARQVQQLIREATPTAANHGTNQHGQSGVSNTKSTSAQPDSTYLLARLKRDRPDLAAQVIDGSMTVSVCTLPQDALGTALERP